MGASKNHDYHLVDPDPWPLIGAVAGGTLFSGAVMWFHQNRYGPVVMAIGLIAVLVTMFNWWKNTIDEAHTGYHTPVVQLHLRYGMILFIASEVMFFVGWFWAFFDFSLFPANITWDAATSSVNLITDSAAAIGQWPPKGLEVLNAWGFPLLNTIILLTSGFSVTWAHHALIHGERGGEKTGLWGLIGVGNRDGVLKGLWLTIVHGVQVSSIQAMEYSGAPFPFKGLNYGASFFMATGFHGFHVMIGTIFLTVCLIRAYRGDFTTRQQFGFV